MKWAEAKGIKVNEAYVNSLVSGCTGIKTGWTSAARGCLSAAAKRGDKELIAVVMHSDDDETRFSEAAALLDYGFEQEEEAAKAAADSETRADPALSQAAAAVY